MYETERYHELENLTSEATASVPVDWNGSVEAPLAINETHVSMFDVLG